VRRSPPRRAGHLSREATVLRSGRARSARLGYCVVDDDVDIRNWQEVIWAMTTRVDPARDLTLVENTPIDYLDFASPVSGLGSKMGIDATNKWPGETTREWGTPITMPSSVKKRVDAIWRELGIG